MKTRYFFTAAGLGILLVLIFISAASTAGASGIQPGAVLHSGWDELSPAGEQSAAAANTWYTETVDSGGVGLYTSLVLSYEGSPHISYFDNSNGILLNAVSYVYHAWYTATVDNLGPLNASYTAIDIEPSTQETQIIYHDFNNDQLKFASGNYTYITQTVTSPGGNYNDFVLGTSDSSSNTVPHVSYYEQNKGDLIYASQDAAGSWYTMTVDSTGDTGWYTSLALDSNNRPHISYYDVDQKDLRWAYLDGSTWNYQTVDSTGDVGWDTSLGIDSAGNIHISYYDFTHGNLNYAFFDHITSSWITETVDSTGDVGWYTSLALDNNDQPHISYYDFTNNSLSYASLEGSTWLTETVDASSADTGRFSSLALDDFDRPLISYYDSAGGSLMFATTYARKGVFIVNDSSDGPDAGDNSPGDGICQNQSGKCTLRAAIEEANAWPGDTGDSIMFQSAMTITLADSLPPVTDQVIFTAIQAWDLTQDQPGVKIDGNQTPVGFDIYTDGCQISGFYLTNFSISAIAINNGSDNIIGGNYDHQRNVISGNRYGIYINGDQAKNNKVISNYIGLTPDGSAGEMNDTGILIGAGASNNIVGGDNADQGNVISGNEVGLWIGSSGTDGNQVGGNLIGVKPDGSGSLMNDRDGVYVTQGAMNTCIGCGSMAANTIRNNGYSGIQINDAKLTTIQDNDISENNLHGIYISKGSDNKVIRNNIHNNGEDGVRVYGESSTGNTISENSITSNGLNGILLLEGANGDIATPIVRNASQLGAHGTACPGCTIEIFSDDMYQGNIYEGDTIANGQGIWQYNGALTGPNVKATATDGDGNTSIFSWEDFDLRKPLIYLPLLSRGG